MSAKSVRAKIAEITQPTNCSQAKVTAAEVDSVLGEAMKDKRLSRAEARAIADLYTKATNAGPRPSPGAAGQRMTMACPEVGGYTLEAKAKAKLERFIITFHIPLHVGGMVTQAIPENPNNPIQQ